MARNIRILFCGASLVLLGLAVALYGQGTAAASPILILSREGRTPLSTSMIGGQEMVALDDLAAPFKIAIREDPLANSVQVTYRDKSILLTPDQTLVSVAGRLVSLPAPLTRSGRRSLVPVEFINRALALVYEEPIELRKASRLLIVGPLKVPRVAVHYEPRGDDGLRVSFDIAPTVGHAIIQEPRRLLVRLEADAVDATIPPPPSQGLLVGARVLDRNTIELVLGQRFASYRSAPPPPPAASTRVLVELLASAPEVTAAPPLAGDPIPSLSSPRPVISTIVLDPGHGGDDAGARGPKGVLEKNVTLAVARRLKTAIETRYGIRVLETREDDRRVGPDERAAYANNNKADVFISLHVNASPQPAVKGAEVYYLGLDRYSDEARRQAHLEGGVLPVFGGGNRQIDLVAWDLAQAQHVERSAVLAGLVESQLRSQVIVSPLVTQQGPMRVLVGVNMPAVLIEIGYVTNPEQEQALASEVYQDRIVQSLTEAIAAFRDYLDGGAGESETRSGAPSAAPATFAR